jgi:CRP/FNR family transcriptional activator FtrB
MLHDPRLELRSTPLFAGLCETALDRLFAASLIQTFPPEVVLFEQATVPGFLYTLIDGAVELTGTHGRQRHTTKVAEAGCSFSLASVVTGEKVLNSARTVRRSRIAMTPAPLVRQLIEDDPAFARMALLTLAALSQSLMRELHNQKLRTSCERLACWLLARTEPREGDQEFRIDLSRQQLANVLSTSPESLSRSIAALEKIGVVFDRNTVRVASRSRLVEVAVPSSIMD